MKTLADLHGNTQNEKRMRDEHHANMEQRGKYLEQCVGDSADKHEQQSKAMAGLQEFQGRHKSTEQRLDALETRVWGAVGMNAKELEVASSVAMEQSLLSARVRAVASDLRSNRDASPAARPLAFDTSGVDNFASSQRSPRLDVFSMTSPSPTAASPLRLAGVSSQIGGFTGTSPQMLAPSSDAFGSSSLLLKNDSSGANGYAATVRAQLNAVRGDAAPGNLGSLGGRG